MFIFVASAKGKSRIKCSLEFARWLVNSGRVVGGVYDTIANKIYL